MNAAQKIAGGLEQFVEGLADVFAEKIRSSIPNGVRNGVHRQLDMTCRVTGCKERSRGPRFRYLCKTHSRVSKKRALQLLKQYRAKAS